MESNDIDRGRAGSVTYHVAAVVPAGVSPRDFYTDDRVRAMSPAQRIEAIGGLIRLNIDNLAAAASIYREAKAQGDDLSQLRLEHCFRYLPHVAAGSLLPELVVEFCTNLTTLGAVARLPLDDQRKLAKGEPIEVAEKGDNGEWTKRKIPLAAIPPAQARELLREGYIPTWQQQAAAADKRRPLASIPAPRRARIGDLKYDRAAATIHYKNGPGIDVETLIRFLESCNLIRLQ
jgi:hypothetical protein